MADRTSTVRVNIITDSSGAGAKLAGFGKVAGAAALGVGALAVGVGFGANKLAEFADVSDDANAKIENVVKTMGLFGKQADVVATRVEDMATSISKATAVDVNSIKATQAKLLTFKELAKTADEVGGAFDRATEAAVDMAALGFGTAETNAVQLGKALNNPLTGMQKLSRAGIEFTEAEQDRIKTLVESNRLGEAQEFMLAAIEKQVGGTAEATAGGFEKMKNELALFGNELAMKALPYLDRFGTFMVETGGPAIAEFGRQFAEDVTPVLKQFGTFLIDDVVPAVQRMAGAFERDILPTLRQFGAWLTETGLPALKAFSDWVMEKVVPVVGEFLKGALEKGKAAFDQVHDAVKRNQPQLEDMWAKFKKVADFVVTKVGPIVADLATDGLPVLGAAISTAIDTIGLLWRAFNTIKNIVQDVIDKVQALIEKINSIPAIPNVPTGGGGASGTKPGGDTPRTTERGSVTVNFNGLVTDPRGAAREVEKVLRRNGVASGVAVG